MKTKKNIIKDFDAVKYMRNIRDQISREIAELSTEQIVEYFKKKQSETRLLPKA